MIERVLQLYKRNCFLEGFLFSMAWTMHVVFHIKTVGFDNQMVVLMGTLYEISIMLFEVPTGVVADMRSRRLSSAIGWVILGLGFLVEGIWPVAGFVILAQLLLGFGETFVSGAHDAWIADEVRFHDPNADLGHAYLTGQRASFIGRILGTWCSLIFALHSLPAVFIASGIGFVVFGIGARLWMPEKGFHASNEQRKFWQTFRDGFGVVRSSKMLLLILLTSIIYGIASEGFDRLWNKVFIDAFQLPKVVWFGDNFWWPFFATLALVGGIALNHLISKRVDTNHSGSIIRAMALLTGILIFTIIGFALVQSFTAALLLFVVSRSIRRAIEPLIKTWTNLHAEPEVRATVLSFASQSHSVGEIIGGPIVGAVGKYQSAKMAVAVAGVLITPALATLGLAKRASEAETQAH